MRQKSIRREFWAEEIGLGFKKSFWGDRLFCWISGGHMWNKWAMGYDMCTKCNKLSKKVRPYLDKNHSYVKDPYTKKWYKV